ncbi:MAG: hypothetical protein ACREDR_08800 [Blastocatellia bacterium]
MAKPNKATNVNYEAYFPVSVPSHLTYMHNVLWTFADAVPPECRQYCTSAKHPQVDVESLSEEKLKVYLLDYVEERLGQLADYEYREWINGFQPFVTPRELQLWRLKIYVQYIWFWSLPDEDDLAMIFNLTKRRAENLASDFIARFRKTIIYPVALRRLYALINTTQPEPKVQKHPKLHADGNIYRVPSKRLVSAAGYLVDDLRAQLPTKRMANPYLWDKEQYRMWIDLVTVDAMKTNEEVRVRLYDMYKIPED